jgi:hypothetical protein
VLAHVGWPTVGLAIVILIGRAIRDKDQTRRLIGLIVVLVAVVVGSVAICVELLGMQVPGFHVAAMTRAAAPVATASPRPAPPVAADPVATASPSGHCHALPDLAQPSAHPPSPAAPSPANHRGRQAGCTGMHARLSGSRQAGTRARRDPSVAVRGKPTVHTDRPRGRTPSAICPWTPRHSGPRRYKVTHGGTEKKRPA